jgi:hypothetical protein
LKKRKERSILNATIYIHHLLRKQEFGSKVWELGSKVWQVQFLERDQRKSDHYYYKNMVSRTESNGTVTATVLEAILPTGSHPHSS